MAIILYVTANVKAEARSRSLLLGSEFLEEYLRLNPQDEVQVVDVYRDSIQRVDEDVLNAWGRVERGEDHSLLSDEERHKINRIWRMADQFLRCDKYVFVTHSLNLWLPAEFKMYVDATCVLDRSYRLTPHGSEGMLRGLPRKSLHLHADSAYSFGRERDQSVAYLRSVLNVLGVAHQETVLLKGDDPETGSWEEYEAARNRLLGLARRF